MAVRFGAESTTEDVLAGVDLKGKRILVTGVSAGLGVETARTLVAHGADVVGAARDLEKAKRATKEWSPESPLRRDRGCATSFLIPVLQTLPIALPPLPAKF
ncbi:MAG: SDR family NAD(P)-dependent oxidoreductase [Edaphobacter sp.]